jgi:hypothetical protein
MIVRRDGSVLHLITQPDHAALAGRIMAHWAGLDSHPHHDSIFIAISEHDNGWREPDAAPSIDATTSRIHDFMTAPAAVRQGVWPRAVERLSHDPWAAALVAQHAVTVYDRFRSDREWADFFREMEAMRDRLVASTALTREQLDADYPFVRIGDLISLVYCNKWREETYREWTFRFDRDVVTVTPDPFGGREIPFEIAAIELPDRKFASDDDLRTSLADAPRVLLTGALRRG